MLLDTHALLGWAGGSGRLSQTAREAISDEAHEVLISAASAWEIATKYRLGRLPAAEPLARDFARTITEQGFDELAITVEDAVREGSLPGPLRDSFDRMLIAQALARNLVLISIEQCFDRYGVSRLWRSHRTRKRLSGQSRHPALRSGLS